MIKERLTIPDGQSYTLVKNELPMPWKNQKKDIQTRAYMSKLQTEQQGRKKKKNNDELKFS